MHTIKTPRLRLTLMSAELLRLIIAEELESATRVAGFHLPDNFSFPKHWATRSLRIAEEDPEQYRWVVHRAIVLKQNNTMIGYIRFHHKPPDPNLKRYSNAGLELGYTILPPFQRNGYGKEAAVAMMNWGHRTARVRDFFLSISPSNAASLGLAKSMGFKKIGEKMDDIDGLEFIMRAGIEVVRKAGLPQS